MNVITLDDLLKLNNKNGRIKVRFHQINKLNQNPLYIYLNDHEEINNNWTFWRTSQGYYDIGDIVVALVKMKDDIWLLTTVRNIEKEFGVKDSVNYSGSEIEEYKKYFGRVIIRYHKYAAQQCPYYETVKDDLIVNEILPHIYDGEKFPGYENVRLSYTQLSLLIDHNKIDWITALENQKAVYLITDTNTGKLYIGSATSENGMLYARWKQYKDTFHGGNIELKELNTEYIKQYFQFSILENFNAKTDDQYVINREKWWKETLCTRKFGYNKN